MITLCNHIMSKPVTVRFDDSLNQFIEKVRGDLTVAETIRNFISYLAQFDVSYSKNILREIQARRQVLN